MPAFKVSVLFQLSTNTSNPNLQPKHIGGWSEQWYWPNNNLSQVLEALRGGWGDGLLQTRAALLPNGAAIIGFRIQEVMPRGVSQSFGETYPGTAGIAQDIPQMALLQRTPGLNAINVRRSTLRGIPDARVVEGEYTPSVAYEQALGAWRLILSDWRFRGRDLSQPNIEIVSITAAGLVRTAVVHGYVVGDFVRISKTIDSNGISHSGRFLVSAIGPLTSEFTASAWTAGATTGGTVRKDGVVLIQPDVNNITFPRILTRRVGRPFGQYRGRASRRRS